MTISVTPADWRLDAQLPTLMLARLSHLGLIHIGGEQARSFIQGQVTTDIASLEANQWRWGAHCDPKGKMLASFRTFAIDDGLMMLMPAPTIEADLPQLQKYAVFSKAQLRDVSDSHLLLGVAGVEAHAWVAGHFGEITDELTRVPGGVIIKDNERYILALDTDHAEPLLQGLSQPIYDETAWQALEIQAGYPNLTPAHQGDFVPQMCNLQALEGISFTKGCYMGQETVARMKYRGGNKRALYILSGSATADISADTRLEMAVEDGYRRAGSIIEWVQRDGRVLLTAVLANDTQADARLRLMGDEGSQLQLLPLPYPVED